VALPNSWRIAIPQEGQSATISRHFLLGLLGLKTKTATPGYDFGEWPFAIFSEVFFYFIRPHAPEMAAYNDSNTRAPAATEFRSGLRESARHPWRHLP
jgi:hypothetical protein